VAVGIEATRESHCSGWWGGTRTTKEER